MAYIYSIHQKTRDAAERRSYGFDIKRILLTKDPKERSVAGRRPGMCRKGQSTPFYLLIFPYFFNVLWLFISAVICLWLFTDLPFHGAVTYVVM